MAKRSLPIDQQAGAFALLLAATHKNQNAKNVHKLRKATRRLRATLWIFHREKARPSLKKLRRDLKKLTHALGALRELDVLKSDARSIRQSNDKEAGARKAAKAKLEKITRPAREKILLQALAHVRAKISKPTEARRARAELRKRLRKWKKPRLNDENFHSFRIDLKKVRYAMEALGRESETLPDMQDTLGKAHDLFVLEQKLGKKTKGKIRARRLVAEANRKKAATLTEAFRLLR